MLIRRILISLNLPGSIEALEQPLGLPASLLQKSEEVRREGGAESITSLSETLSALRDADLRLLNEAIQILDEEERQDTEMRNHLKNRWTRPPSAQLNKNLREAGDSFKEKLVLAQKSDSMIQRKLEDHLPSIDALGSNRADLEASIPASSPASSIGGKDPIVKAMRALLNELGGLQSSFKETMDQAKKLAKEDSILLPLTEALSRNSNFDPEPMYSQGLRKYEPLTNQLNKLRQGQDVVLQSIHETYKKLSGSIHTSRSISEREHALSTLDAGYRFFKEIQANVTEGVKFYNDFQNVLSKFHGNCKDFAFARDIDRKDGLARVQEEMANMRINPGGSSPQQGYAMPQYEYGHANSPRPSGPVPGVWNPNAPQQPPFNPTYNYSASRRPQ